MKKLLLTAIALVLSANSFALSIDVHALQRKLKALGYYSGDIHGVVDDKTRKALERYMNRGACPTNVEPEICSLLLEVQRKINNT